MIHVDGFAVEKATEGKYYENVLKAFNDKLKDDTRIS